MPFIIATDTQSKWKDSFASSGQVRLTLRANGEEEGTVITPQNQIVQAGFDAPTVAPTMASGSAGNPTGSFYYIYCYASSRYPFVDSIVTAGGETWPRSNPSPASAAVVTVTTTQIVVTVTKTTRSDVDYILIYRTANGLTATEAEAAAAAGEFFYVGRATNNGVAGTTTYTDNNAANTGEVLEIDNFSCPLFRFTVFDGSYWWGFANTEFRAQVTLNGTSAISLVSATDEWFSGRDASVCTFYGVPSGGFDGKGSFYFKRDTVSTATLYSDADLLSPLSISATGTTEIRIQTNPATLYRSKLRNPFSWGRTTTTISDSGTLNVADMWAEPIGGGQGSALALIPNELVLKVDCEQPTQSYALDLSSADSDAFMGTKRTLDSSYSTSSHFSQFASRLPSKQTVLSSVDAKTNQILQSDAGSQVPIGDNAIKTLRKLITDGTNSAFFHGIYDAFTELNCWWVKAIEPSVAISGSFDQLVPKITHLIYQHAPTGRWGVMPDFEVLCSASVYDPTEGKTYTLIGTQNGNIGRAFVPDYYSNFMEEEVSFRSGTVVSGSNYTSIIIASQSLQDLTIDAGFTTGSVTLVSTAAYAVGSSIVIEGSGWPIMRAIVASKTATVLTLSNIKDITTGLANSTNAGTKSCFINRYPSLTPDPQGYIWYFLSNATGTTGFWAKGRMGFSSAFGAILNCLYIPEDLSDIIETSPGTVDSTWKWYSGLMPCRARRYFDGSNAEKAKRLVELWATQMNLDTVTAAQFVRFYKEYDETVSSAITLSRDSRPGGASNSNVYFNRTAIPSGLSNSFGMEFIELGYEQYQLLNFTLKVNNA